MVSIHAIKVGTGADWHTRDAAADGVQGPASRNALVCVKPVMATRARPSARPDSAFLAQLIATADQAPQTRERRRAAPEFATGVYASQEKRVRSGRIISARI